MNRINCGADRHCNYSYIYCVYEILLLRLHLQTWQRYKILRLCGTNLTERQLVFKYKFLLGENNTITETANNTNNTTM